MGKKSLSLNESAAEPMDTTADESVLGAPSTDKDAYSEQCALVNRIASPLANRKHAKKLYKLIKKSADQKGFLRAGIADVTKAIRRDEKGIVIMAGNVTPIDIYSHIPGFCEDKDLPYVFTPSRESLGLATGRRRPAVVLMVKPHESYQELYDEIYEQTNTLVPEGI